jgi:D-3-phosphoglycerate dehydrogenase / 2-oxoglutarate reductase
MTDATITPISLNGRTILVAPHHVPDLQREHELAEEMNARLVVAEDADQFRAALTSAAVVMVTPYVKVDAAAIERLERPAAIVRYGIGYENIDVEAARRAGIPVSIVPDASSDEVASHAFAMGVALTRRLPVGDAAIREGRWAGTIAYDTPPFGSLRVGIVGFGRIGRVAARLYQAIGAQVRAYDPFIDVDEALAAELQDVLESSDVVSLHVPLGPHTANLISRDVLKRMTPGAVVVNVSRGGLIDEDALAEALTRGVIGGAGLDTFSSEPLSFDSPLRTAPNLILTPHVAWRSTVSVGALQAGAVLRARLAITGEPLVDLV